jgi:hypothetical protein
MASLKIRPALFILLFFLLCFALRVIELLVIRTDQSVVGEAFIHKLLSIALLAGALWFWRLKWRDIGFRGDKLARGIALGLLFGAGAFAIAYGVELFVQVRGGGAPSLRVAHYRENPKASIYFYDKRFFRGVMRKGSMEELTDAENKEVIWRDGDIRYYSGGVTDPDYCVLRFTAASGRYYSNFKSEDFAI